MSKITVAGRAVDVTYGETGQSDTTRVEKEYQLGLEIDGVFVPITTVAQGRVDMYTAQAQAAKQKQAADKAAKQPADDDQA